METNYFPTCDSNFNPKQTNTSKQNFVKILLMTFSFHSSNDFTLHLTLRAPLYTVKSIELSAPKFKGLKQTLLALTCIA